MTRKAWTWLVLGVGVVLMVVSYFFLTTPWGSETVADSNPRMEWAPLLFVIGVITAFASALVYELLPDRRREQ